MRSAPVPPGCLTWFAQKNDSMNLRSGGSPGHNEVELMSQSLAFGNTEIDAASLEEVCRRYSVKELSLFGSAVRGEMRPESDIDVMVEFEPGVRVGLIKFESLAEELEVLAGRRVDLVTRRGLKPWVRPAVLKDARVIYAA
jgi:predicted nucleotidyltransferase